MVEYRVTMELKTSWWLKILRFFRIKNKREEFTICFPECYFQKGDILTCGNNTVIKIIGYEK